MLLQCAKGQRSIAIPTAVNAKALANLKQRLRSKARECCHCVGRDDADERFHHGQIRLQGSEMAKAGLGYYKEKHSHQLDRRREQGYH